MTQTVLIERIHKGTYMEDCNLKHTPAEKNPLCKDEKGLPCCENWDYRSIVGMVLYLSGSTRPDIAYDVHQCARFSHAPKHRHEIGVKHSARYLKGNKMKGILMKSDTNNLCIDM